MIKGTLQVYKIIISEFNFNIPKPKPSNKQEKHDRLGSKTAPLETRLVN